MAQKSTSRVATSIGRSTFSLIAMRPPVSVPRPKLADMVPQAIAPPRWDRDTAGPSSAKTASSAATSNENCSTMVQSHLWAKNSCQPSRMSSQKDASSVFAWAAGRSV